MRRRRLIIAFVCVLAAGLSAGAIVMRQSTETTHLKAKKEKTVKVVVVKKELSRGIKLTKGDLMFREWPEKLAAPEYLRSITEAEGRVIVSNVFPGEPLLKTKLAPKGSAVGLSNLIPRGRRAFSIKVSEVTGVAGFLLPGSRVDVHATFKIKSNSKIKKPSTNENFITKTILQDVEVLASGGEKEAGQNKDRMKVPVVTLLLTPEEADKIALAATAAQSIWLSMREPRDDAKRKQTKLISIEEVLRSNSSPKRSLKRMASKPRVRRKSKPKAYVVEIIKDGKKTYSKF